VVLQESKIVACTVMPLVKGKSEKDVVDLGEVKRIVLNWMKQLGAPSIFVIEKQSPRPSVMVRADEKPCPECKRVGKNTGSLANWHRGYSLALLEMLCVCLGLRYALVAPRTWQADMLRDVPHVRDTKQAALVVAKRLWPNQNWLASERSKKPHDGIVDASLLALYSERRFL
jgi:hypothetical protein